MGEGLRLWEPMTVQSGEGCPPPPQKKKDIWQLSVYLVLSLSCPNNSNVCTGFKIPFICCLYIGPFWFLALLIGGKSKLCNYQQVNGAAEEADRQGRLRAGALSPGGRDTHSGNVCRTPGRCGVCSGHRCQDEEHSFWARAHSGAHSSLQCQVAVWPPGEGAGTASW